MGGGRATAAHHAAVENEIAKVGAYKPQASLSADGLSFTRELVLNGLALAPAPLSDAWVRMTLAAVSRLVAHAEATGQALIAEQVLSDHTIDSCLHAWDSVSANTKYQVKGRLLRLRRFLGEEPAPAYGSAAARGSLAQPMTLQQENTLWADSARLRPDTQRRVRVTYGLGLGCGLTAREIVAVRGADIEMSNGGLRVAVDRDDMRMWIPCRRVWEARLWEAVADLDRAAYLYSGGEQHVASKNVSALLARVQDDGQWACNTHEMRNTWLVRLLDAGLSMLAVMALAGMKDPTHLYRLREYVRQPDLDALDAVIREA